MKNFSLVKIILALTFSLYFNPAHSVLVDISGVSVNYDTPFTFTVTENENFSWDSLTMAFSFEVEHFNESWLIDTMITAQNSYWKKDYSFTGYDCGFVAAETGIGLCDIEINIAEDALIGDTWTFTLMDTFPDPGSMPINPQYTFLANSYIGWGDDLEFVRNNHAVPEPSVLTLMGLGLLGFFAARRKC